MGLGALTLAIDGTTREIHMSQEQILEILPDNQYNDLIGQF
jgi:hypothetical protein